MLIFLIYFYSPFNKWPGSEYECSTTQRVIEFDGYLNSHGLRSTIRWSRGEGKCVIFVF
jgi:adenine C2-methylase RlmN of 23S rRNA A2503 and tRNA A37